LLPSLEKSQRSAKVSSRGLVILEAAEKEILFQKMISITINWKKLEDGLPMSCPEESFGLALGFELLNCA
jgi:hypothetical protein